MFANRFANLRPALVRGATTLAAAAAIGIGGALATANPAFADGPVPVPPVSPVPAGVAGPGGAGPAAGVNAANSFLQVLNGMLNRVVPGAGSLMPSDVSALTPPAAGAPGAPLPAPAPAGGVVPQTLAGAWTLH
ncbi:hypothetical protein KIH27_08485 [Mycobacterium sp. M1]|uniref:Secreted protein n=1 Tax=Mycolicibacter acidiphilus TaxID=2835306 RepID=A0ABS5RH46_9MYCO|nr:hypothetical protein [Mycolicibacter acidiphilus]MBS9533620.1 hypothetical protein [Mycolicibacter acidiphilus]